MGSIHGVEAFPLYWPEGWTRHTGRRPAGRYQVSFAQARAETLTALKALGATDIVISSNIPLRRDGLAQAGLSEPMDVGVAVYWVEGKGDNKQHRVMACDCWSTTRANLRAIHASIEAFRTLARAGASQVLDRAYRGLLALPASTRRPWRVVFDYSIADAMPGADALRTRFRILAAERHPDKPGGSSEAMAELNEAFETAKKELGYA